MNPVLRRLQAGELSFGLSLRQARGGDIARIARTCGFDWLFIDLEHNSMSIDAAAQIALAGLEAGIQPLFRVGGHEPFHANRVLTNGGTGIFFPHVDKPAEAALCAANCRFAPAGHRGVPGLFPHLGYEKPPLADAIRRLNELTLCIVMIESAEAVANAEAIAAQPGIDILFVGASDLTVELGVPGEYGHPRMTECFDAVAAACAKHGRQAGFGGVSDYGVLGRLMRQGYRFVLAGNDVDLLMLGAKSRLATLNGLVVGQPG